MATVVGGLVVVGIGVFGVAWFIKAFASAQEERDNLKAQIEAADEEITRVVKAKQRLEHWRRLSLPANLSVARSEYRKELEKLIRDTGLTWETFGEAQQDSKSSVIHPTKPGKVPVYTGINYSVRLKAPLEKLVELLQSFQRMPRMQRIKKLSIERPSSTRDGTMLTATIDFEGLVILDADLKRNIVIEKKFMVPDMVAAFHKVPFGVGGYAWYLSPQGPYVPSVNPPLAERKYDDIRWRNFFIGPSTPPITDKGPKIPGGTGIPQNFGPIPSDETINMMRFSRFVSLVTDEHGKPEAKVWDMYNNQTQRLGSGVKKFGMVQTGQFAKIIQGSVHKIDGSEIIYRINLNAEDAPGIGTANKWWRYPDRPQYYTLHADDLATLVSSGKAKAADKANLYLVPQIYWDHLVKRDRPEIEVSQNGKAFRYFADPSLKGEVVDSDREVRIVRLTGSPPSTPLTPSISAERVYPKKMEIYHVATKHFNDMVAASSAGAGAAKGGGKGGGKQKGAGAVNQLKKEDIERTYCVQTWYWDMLAKHRILVPDSFRNEFSFYKGTICGDIISRTDDLVVFRVYEKYSHCPADPDRKTEERWHEGYCVLKLDQFVQESLHEPLPEARRVALKLPK